MDIRNVRIKVQNKTIQKNNTHTHWITGAVLATRRFCLVGCTADRTKCPHKSSGHTTGPEQNPTQHKPRGSTSGVMVPDFSALLSLGTGVIRRWWLVLLLLAAPEGNPPAVGQCVCVRPHREGRMSAIEHHAAAPAPRTPYPRPPTPSVLPRTLTYSRSRFCDTNIKAFLCFSVSLLSSSPCVTRALSAGALAQDIESAFKLTQSLFTSALW